MCDVYHTTLDFAHRQADTPYMTTTTTYGRSTVVYRGRPTEARRVEMLPNGYWRADLAGGLVVLYAIDHVRHTHAKER